MKKGIARTHLHAFHLRTFDSLALPNSFHAIDEIQARPWAQEHQSINSTPEHELELRTCVVCGTGDCSIGHWMRWCRVLLIVARLLQGESVTEVSMQAIAAGGRRQLVVASHVLHQFPRLLIDHGGLQHGDPTRHAFWIQALGTAVHQALPPDVRRIPWPLVSDSSEPARV